MKPARPILVGAIAAVLSAAPFASAQTQQIVAPPATAAATTGDPVLDPIVNAPDPSAAVDAYGKAMAAGRDPVSVETAFMRRMIDFGLPEMAATQATDLTYKTPNNAQAWAVLANVNARKGDTNAAAKNLTQ